MSDCRTRQDLLTDYLEGDLDSDRSTSVEAHLARCAACRDLLGELQRVRRWAREAEPMPPASDPWDSIEDEIRAHRTGYRGWALAAAALVVVGLAVMLRLAPPSTAPQTAPAPPVARGDADAAIESLEQIVASARHHLDPETLRTLEESLASIDEALDRAERALATDPDNEIYRRLLEESRERKRGVLRQAVRRAERWESVGGGV